MSYQCADGIDATGRLIECHYRPLSLLVFLCLFLQMHCLRACQGYNGRVYCIVTSPLRVVGWLNHGRTGESWKVNMFIQNGSINMRWYAVEVRRSYKYQYGQET